MLTALRNYSYFILALLACSLKGLSQTPASEKDLVAKFDTWRSKTLQEKLFVHTDKSFYLAGEVLWYKIYAVDGAYHRPLDLSKVAYVEILDKDNKFVLQAKTGLLKAEGAGSFYLPLSLVSGNYKLRAYTNWMKNFGPDCFFEAPLTIVNTLKGLPAVAPAAAGGYHINFFPEGGNLVKGLLSRIAFEVTGPDGRGISCKGRIIQSDNSNLLASFQTLRSGIGSFYFTPPGNGLCKAVVELPDGQALTAELPEVYDKGMVMQVGEKKDDQLLVTVHARGLAGTAVYLFAQTREAARLAKRAVLTDDSTTFILDKKELGQGVSRLTLFDARMQPLCERLYFRRPESPLTIDVTTDQTSYGIRKKVRMDIKTSEENSRPQDSLTCSLSLAVYRLDSLSSPQGMDIANYLWLSSDLRGTIESPETYFSGHGEQAGLALDNLMLTHGWRRFRWENILNGEEPSFPYPPEYAGHLITGRLTDMKTGKPLTDRLAYLSIPGIQFGFQTAVTDSTGKFAFDIRNFYGPGGIVIHSGEAADSPCKTDVFSPFSEIYSDRQLSPFTLTVARPGKDKETLAAQSVGMQVQNIYSGDSLQRFRAPSQDSLRFFSHPDHSYVLDDYTRFTTMEEVLREYVREINVNHSYGRLHVKVINEPLHDVFDDNDDLVLLDGVPVPDDKIFAYDPLKVKRLDVMSRQYFLGPASFNGIASFTTYKGDYEDFELDRHSLLVDYEGLQMQREFYSPVYATEQQSASRLPDFRSLLFWSPSIHTATGEKTEYSFYTSDLPGRYVAVIQGLAANGRPGVQYVYFDVL
jgi:hypothetical protein